MVACAGTVWGCGENRLSPASPSLMSAPGSEGAPRSGASITPRRVDADGDGYDDPEPGPMPAPGTPPPADQVPPPEGMPAPDGIPLPVPVQLTISIIGSFGTGAYAPNPQQAAIGNLVVWTNNDFAPHNIVLDDGTPVGNLAPGQSSPPITLATETAGYHCTIHPSMTGQIVPIPRIGADGPVANPGTRSVWYASARRRIHIGYDDGYDDYDY